MGVFFDAGLAKWPIVADLSPAILIFGESFLPKSNRRVEYPLGSHIHNFDPGLSMNHVLKLTARFSKAASIFGIAAMSLFAIQTARADVVAFDDYDGGGDGNLVSLLARGNSGSSFAVVDDSAGIGSGNAIEFAPNRTTNSFAGFLFPQVDLASVDDYLTVSFDIRLNANVTSEQDFRFGVFNDGGTAAQTLNDQSTDDNGYFYTLDTEQSNGSGGGGTEIIRVVAESAGDTALSGSTNYIDRTDNEAGILTDSVINYEFTLTRTADDTLALVFLADGVELSDMNHTTDASETVTTTFNQMFIGSNGTDLAYRVDNITIRSNLAAVPEPGSAIVLTLAGTLACLVRRRK